jgi:nuclear pore complex protein Nup107
VRQNYEKNVAQALYGYLRGGKLDDALELCRKAQQSWRAASIRGSMLFKWRAIGELSNCNPKGICPISSLANEPEEEPDMSIEEYCEGNKRRNLWKSTCIRAALNVCPSQSRCLASDPPDIPLLKLSKTYLNMNAFSTQLSHLRLKHSQFSNLHVGLGKTIFGLNSVS